MLWDQAGQKLPSTILSDWTKVTLWYLIDDMFSGIHCWSLFLVTRVPRALPCSDDMLSHPAELPCECGAAAWKGTSPQMITDEAVTIPLDTVGVEALPGL